MWSKTVNGSADPVTYLRRVHVMRRELRNAMAERFKVKLSDGDVLLDVPPAGKDQVDDIFVDLHGTPTSINELSAMGNAVRSTFKEWTRTVRIFLSAGAFEKCLKRKTRSKLEADVYFVLDTLYPFEFEGKRN